MITVGMLAVFARGDRDAAAARASFSQIRELGALMQPFAPDYPADSQGRVDPFQVMAPDAGKHARDGWAANADAIRRGDYRSFPYGRGMAKGEPRRMLFWSREPDPEMQTRLVHFADGTTSIISETEFQARIAESTSNAGS